jgi:hypothetical protein
VKNSGRAIAFGGDNENKPGTFGGVFNGFKDRKTTLQGPVGICIDKQDRMWVSAVSGRIQQFTAAGKFLRGFGEEGPSLASSTPRTPSPSTAKGASTSWTPSTIVSRSSPFDRGPPSPRRSLDILQLGNLLLRDGHPHRAGLAGLPGNQFHFM